MQTATTCGLAAATLLTAVATADTTFEPVDTALARADQALKAIIDIPDDQRTFKNTMWALDDTFSRLELDTNMLTFMPYVSTDADERDAGTAAQQKISNWAIETNQREDLYNAIKAFTDTNPSLSGEDARFVERTLRDYRRAGMDLSPEDRSRLAELRKELNRLSIEFDENIRTDETTVMLTRAELTGMSEEYLATINRSGGIYMVGLSYPEFLPIMDLCDNEMTRKKVWLAYKRRAGQKNVRVLDQVLALRKEAAELLGYKTAADYETEVRMAKNADTVLEFYAKLRPLVRAKAEKDFAELTQAKRDHTGDRYAHLFPWDTGFYKNRVKKENYAVDSEKVREYFPMEAVTDGLFSITQSLYGLEYRDITDQAASKGMPLWHEDVRLFEVWDNATSDMLGMFYIDLHPRDNKYGHAAQWGLSQHKIWSDGTVNKPLAALVCNFTKPTPDKPSLMSHDEVETYFHEFGHCLHTILSDAKLWQFSGTAVERDFVEAPSQMFENWVWDADVLKTFARHYQTGEVFPDDLLDGMLAARYLGSGMDAERQFYYGLTDMTYHTAYEDGFDTTEVANELFGEVELYDPVPGAHFQAAFGHLMGYQAGYYGYQWSLVYAADMFQRFKELGMLDPEAGKYYRDKILSRGGTVDGLDMVRDYLGREPDMTAYLKHLGLEE